MSACSLRVCLDARVISRSAGGVQQVVIGLASGLSKLTDGNEQYLFLTYADEEEWIRPYLEGPCQILRGPKVPQKIRMKQRLSSAIPPLRDAWHKLSWLAGLRSANLSSSDGTIERAGVEVMHFTTPDGFFTHIPSIYQPYDLQHLHLPEFFSARASIFRETTYRAFCAQAQMVAAMNSWGKTDLIRYYGLPEEKVHVVPLAPVLTAYPVPQDRDQALVQKTFRLPDVFVFYPAQTWPHKNHIGLLKALAILRDRHGLTVPLVCSGFRNGFFTKIRREIYRLKLTDQVRFLGFVSPLEIQCLYHLCRCMVFPSKFEGFGMPLVEAFHAGAPTACSNIAPLCAQASGAALLFHPDNPEEITECIKKLWTDSDLRKDLAQRGKRSVAPLSWDSTARTFRAHYRRIKNRNLTEEDRQLLATPPLF